MKLTQRFAAEAQPREVVAGAWDGRPLVWRVRRVRPSTLHSFHAVAMLVRVPQADDDEAARVAQEIIDIGGDARTVAQAIRETDRRARDEAKMLDTPENVAKMVSAAVDLLSAGVVALRDDDDVDDSAGEWVPVAFAASGADILMTVGGVEVPMDISICKELQNAVLMAAMPRGVREQLATFRDGSDVGGHGDDDRTPVQPVTGEGLADAGG